MKPGDKIGIVCCSNGRPKTEQSRIEQLRETLLKIGLTPVLGNHIYQQKGMASGTGRERAEDLMRFFRDDEIKAIFDLSGGDLANEILPFLDYDEIAGSDKQFWGYSDLTTVINAIYAKTGKTSVLYQIRNLIDEHGKQQFSDLKHTLLDGNDDLYGFQYKWVQKDAMEGVVVGGNIRCLLKLAGTPYWPDMNGCILLLESFHGGVPQMVTYLNQLKQIGVFDAVNGILLGTFTEMEEKGDSPSIEELVREYAGSDIPIAKTKQIGHGSDSKGILIGRRLSFGRRSLSTGVCR